ncbi:hypothetical protein J6590_076508 [Homalodisca vitripennis]|nr:hypothetical protein J6590_076508 [Homalodisca vitripennis]
MVKCSYAGKTYEKRAKPRETASFKRKEHLNLHFVIHSGEKTEVCPECGKGFYRKDHLRKHARSHLAKRVKEELQQAGGAVLQTGPEDDSPNTVILPSAAETHPVALITHLTFYISSAYGVLTNISEKLSIMIVAAYTCGTVCGRKVLRLLPAIHGGPNAKVWCVRVSAC